MSIRRTPQTIAMAVRWYNINSIQGATYATYPNGPGTRPVYVEYTRTELCDNARAMETLCDEWNAVDHGGCQAWRMAWLDDQTSDPTRYARS